MICKDNVVFWFKELESYKRIDTMCTLLNMCLPFELRFLGTCLEELGRRDSQELRGIELRVNNPTELAADIASCQSGEPTDMKIRRKMALYLALIRVCSRPCVNELYRTLDAWGERDLSKFSDGDPLQELLLVYTMATNHPVFSFEQRMKCAEIFTKIKESRPQPAATVQHHISPQQPLLTNSTPSPPSMHTIQQHHHQLMGQPQQHPMHFTQMIPGADPQLVAPQLVDQMMQLPPSMTIPQHDFTVGPPTTVPWTMRPHGTNIASQPVQQPASLDTLHAAQQQPAQSTSPLLSQPSSPTQSRSTSPTRSGQGGGGGAIGTNLPQQHHMRGNQMQTHRRASRRSSVETTPPPVAAPQNYANLLGSEILVQQQNHKNFEEMLQTVDGALSQLQTICRNGYTRPAHTIARQPTKGGSNYAQSSQNHHQSSNFTSNPPGLVYALNNMAFDHHQVKSGGSDSGSSVGSTGDLSPPDTPSARLRPGKLHIYTPPAAVASPAVTYASGEICVAQGGATSMSQFQATSYPTFRQPPPPIMAPIASPTTVAATTTFRHPYQLQPNGEFIYPYTQTAQIALIPSQQPPPPIRSSPSLQKQQQQHFNTSKMVLSCFNCGSQMHTGRDCQESSMEDATRGAIYKLDYNATTTSSTQTSVVDTVTTASTQDVGAQVAAINK